VGRVLRVEKTLSGDRFSLVGKRGVGKMFQGGRELRVNLGLRGYLP